MSRGRLAVEPESKKDGEVYAVRVANVALMIGRVSVVTGYVCHGVFWQIKLRQQVLKHPRICKQDFHSPVAIDRQYSSQCL